MVKLIRGAKPVELTAALQQALTLEFKTNKTAVWKKKFIEEGLLSYSKDKCCYCEMNVTEESKYMEVEHFHHKEGYPDEVVEWDNLLPSCKKCNTTKGSHDTKIEPTTDDPKVHLRLFNYRLKPKTPLGRVTIDTLNLNDQNRLVLKRAQIGSAIQDKVDDLNTLLSEYVGGSRSSTRTKNRIVNGVKALLKEGLPISSYSATSAHIIMNDSEFADLKSNLIKSGLWDTEHIALEIEVTNNAL